MALEQLINDVLDANRSLPVHGLVKLTSGNVSGVDRERGVMVIKPSGVAYDRMTAADMVVVAFDGTVVAGERRPSTDTPTHLALYRRFDDIGGIVHTHSTWATAWAQAARPIPLLGTTHADLCAYPIPVTRPLTEEDIAADYEASTGAALIEAIGEHDALHVPCVLVRGHAPFGWGRTPAKAVETAVMLEAVAELALLTALIDDEAAPLAPAIRQKHFARKHGAHAYYGQ